MVRTPPPGKSQKIGFLSNTDPDPKKITELPSQHSVFGHHRRFAGGPMIVIEVFGSFLPHQTKTKRQKKNPNVKRYQSWTPSDKTFWIRT